MGPLKTVGEMRRGRVAEWPVTDPILRGWYDLKTTRWPNDGPRPYGESGRRRPFRQDPVSGPARDRPVPYDYDRVMLETGAIS